MLIDFLRDNLWTGIVGGGERARLILETATKIGTLTRSCPEAEDLLLDHGGQVGVLPMYSGDVDLDGLSSSVCSMLCTFGVPVKMTTPSTVHPSLTEVVEGLFCMNGDRLIERMAHSPELSQYGRLLILTDLPVSNDRKIWVHGYAGLRVPVAVVSTGRMIVRPDEGVRKVTIHELAHTFGIPHCREKGCVMRPGPLHQVSMQFCDLCAGRLMALSSRSRSFPSSPVACSLSC